MVPSILMPKQFNYFEKVSPEGIDLESFSAQAEECMICMTNLCETEQEPGVTQGRLQKMCFRRMGQIKHKIMKTPCEHKFHVHCLMEWMNIKMELFVLS